jgi:ribonuclease P protein component
MLPKLNRIKKKKDFEEIFKNSKSIKQDLLVFRVFKNGTELKRFSPVVSLKVSKKAVVRNKIRRRLSVIIQKFLPEVMEGYDILAIALAGLEKKEYLQLEDSVKKALAKAGVLKK